MAFTHLHLHTPYSLLDGFCRIDQLMEEVKSRGMEAVAITDHGNLFGAIAFYKAAKAAGVHPILGCEVYVAEDRFDRSTRERYHLVLLAENNTGYHNLMKIVSRGYLEGMYYKPRVDKEVLRAHHEGIIALSACVAGECAQRAMDSPYEVARDTALVYEEIFGRGNFFLEIQDHTLREEALVRRVFQRIHRETGIGLVATNDCHYVDQSESSAHDVLLCIQTGATLDQEKRMRFPNDQFYLRTPEEMEELFQAYEGALENTEIIAKRCQVNIPFHQLHLPHFAVPTGETNVGYLTRLVEEGLRSRYGENEEAEARASYELRMIEEMGFVDYFLIVSDFVHFALAHDISVGPGRGSAAGSIVSYALGITGIDPLEHDLLFERFLNPERVSMPDIDIDFNDERREEVIDYVRQRYGAEKVAQIITFGTLAAKNAIRDVGRVLNVPLHVVDKIAKAVPNTLKITLSRALEEGEEFRRLYQEDATAHRVIDIAREIEGMPRHTMMHAAGVLIAGEAVENLVPLYVNQGLVLTQFNMTELEELGLLKMDFLGLRNLTVIDHALDMVEMRTGHRPDMTTIDLNDPKVMQQFTAAETIGIFQFESPGMRRFLAQLKPERFDDLVAANALFRPGPMDEIPTYVEARHHPEKIRFLTPKLQPILKNTYGVIVYQEQVMQIVQQLAGYTLGGADNLRRAMSKKKMAVMEENREWFVNGKLAEDGTVEIAGCVRNGIPSDVANAIYDQMIAFARYAFNKSHSVAYSYLAMETAALKCYAPCEYFAALLTSVIGSFNKMELYIHEAERLGIELLPPDVNASVGAFSVEEGKIRIGIHAIKSVGTGIVAATVAARKADGPFHSLEEYMRRVVEQDATALNRAAVESMIKAGAMDAFGVHRSQLMADLEMSISGIQHARHRNLAGQTSLFDTIAELEDPGGTMSVGVPPLPLAQKLAFEKEVLGIYLSGHPFAPYEAVFAPYGDFDTGQLALTEDLEEWDGRQVRFAGLVEMLRPLQTKRQESMAVADLTDRYGSLRCVFFPKVYRRAREKLATDVPLLVSGHLQVREDEVTLLADAVQTREELPPLRLYLSLRSMERALFDQVRQILKEHPGPVGVSVYLSDRKQMRSMKEDFGVDGSAKLMTRLRGLLGTERVQLRTERRS